MTNAYEAGRAIPIELRHRLRIAREEAGFDQEDLAAEIGVARNTIVNAETGKVAPRRIVLRAWALACGVRLSWLMTGLDSNGGGDGQQTDSDINPVFLAPKPVVLSTLRAAATPPLVAAA
jgi:DNA-binding XRE family transcriptional regulator